MSFKAPLLATILLAAASRVNADRVCGPDRNGYYYRCNGLSNGVRIGIGIAVAIVAIVAIVAFGALRRRRLRAHNQSYIVNTQTQPAVNSEYNTGYQQQQPYTPGGYQPYNGGQWNQGGQQYGGYDPTQDGNGTQYPPPSHQFDGAPSGGFAPPPGSPHAGTAPPPTYTAPAYAPPTGPPPTTK